MRLHWIGGTITSYADMRSPEDDEAQREYNRIVEDEHPFGALGRGDPMPQAVMAPAVRGTRVL